MNTSKEAKKRIKYQGDNKKKKKIPLIIIGSVLLLGGVACAVVLPLTFCNKPVPPGPVEKAYTIKTDGSDEYFGFVNNSGSNPNDINQLTGFIDGVMSAKDKSFYSEKFTKLVVPAGITSIDESAFYGCASFRDSNQPIKVDFNLESSFISIGAGAFWGCTGITSVDFSGSDNETTISSIGGNAFNGCTLSSIIPGAGIVDRTPTSGWNGMHVFGLNNFTPNYTNVDTIPLYNSGCGCLAYGTFAPISEATSIGIGAFHGCAGITAVDFSQNIGTFTYIGSDAFYGCALSSITQGSGVSDRTPTNGWNGMHVFGLSDFTPNYTNSGTVGLYFTGCGCLAYGIFAPAGNATPIGASAFLGCAGITAVNFSNFVLPLVSSSIGASSFRDCAGIRSYTFASTQEYDSNFTIGDWAFVGGALSGKVISNPIGIANGLLPLMIGASGNPAWMSDYWITAIN